MRLNCSKENHLSQQRASRMTVQRRTILEEVRASHSHPTADEIYHRVRRRLPRISLGTVYRNLEALASQGAIQRLDLSGVQRRFDHQPTPHFHVRCVRCGVLNDVELSSSAILDELVDDAGGFEILDARLEFLGICPGCQRETEDPGGNPAVKDNNPSH
jgi:Fur family ferric uptake transcriptional regulator